MPCDLRHVFGATSCGLFDVDGPVMKSLDGVHSFGECNPRVQPEDSSCDGDDPFYLQGAPNLSFTRLKVAVSGGACGHGTKHVEFGLAFDPGASSFKQAPPLGSTGESQMECLSEYFHQPASMDFGGAAPQQTLCGWSELPHVVASDNIALPVGGSSSVEKLFMYAGVEGWVLSSRMLTDLVTDPGPGSSGSPWPFEHPP